MALSYGTQETCCKYFIWCMSFLVSAVGAAMIVLGTLALAVDERIGTCTVMEANGSSATFECKSCCRGQHHPRFADTTITLDEDGNSYTCKHFDTDTGSNTDDISIEQCQRKAASDAKQEHKCVITDSDECISEKMKSSSTVVRIIWLSLGVVFVIIPLGCLAEACRRSRDRSSQA